MSISLQLVLANYIFVSSDCVDYIIPRSEPRLELGVHFWNYVKLFWNSLDNAPSSIVFHLEMKVEVEVGVHDIRSRFEILGF